VIDLRRREGRPLRVGHRGAAALAPENTIASLALALELGCDVVEVDVLDLDGGLVLAHSPVEVPSELATLDEALAFVAGTPAVVQLDLKTAGAEARLVEAVRRHGLLERAVVSTFRPASLRALEALEPDLCRGLTYPEDRFGLSRIKPLVGLGLTAMRSVLPRRIGRMLAAAGANAAMLHWEVVTRAVVERCHELSAPVFAWTVASADEVRGLTDLGVDGLIVDDPRIFEG
jgi:glycerophosphoryl diester phosphodiesterase